MRRLALALALALGACAREPAEQPGERTEAVPAGAAADTGAARGYRPPRLALAPAGGPPGTEVRLALEGLVVRADVEIGFGGMAEHVILGQAEADANGALATTVTVPASAAPGTAFFFVADAGTGQPVSTPTPFLVAAADGKVSVTGRMTDEGVECAALRSDDGELYTLSGADDLPEAGTRVTVEGAIAEMSICQQGLTIVVGSLRALP